MVLRKAIKLVQVGNKWEVREPGYNCRALPTYAVYFTQVGNEHLITSQDLGRTYVRMGALDQDILNAKPQIVAGGRKEARLVARKIAKDLAEQLANQRGLPFVYIPRATKE